MINEEKVSIEDWSKATYEHPIQAKHHAAQVNEYLEWAGLTPEEAVKEARKLIQTGGAERRILNYYSLLKEQRSQGVEGAKTESSAFDAVYAVRSFYRYYRVNLKFNKNELKQPVPVYIDHRFTLAEISGMVHAASSPRNKSIILFATSAGLREGDIAKMKRERIQCLLSQEPPVGIGPLTTEKARVTAYPFLHKAAVESLKEYLATREDDIDLLFPTDQGKPCDGHYLDRMVKESYRKAGFKAPKGERVRFHNLRKFTISRMQDAGLEENVWKCIIGKKTKEAPYTTEQLREHFIKVQDRLNPEAVANNHAKLEDVTSKLDTLGKENADLRIELNELKTKKTLEFVMEMFGDKMKQINQEAFEKAVPASATLNGHRPTKIEPISINGSEVLTLKALAQTMQTLYDEQKREKKN